MRRLLAIMATGFLCLALSTGCASGKKGCPGQCAGCTNKCPSAQAGGKHFGEKMKLTAKDSLRAADVLAAPDKYADKFIRIVGTAEWVCQKSGHAMGLAGNDIDETLFVRVMIPSEGRLLPIDIVNKSVVVEGRLKVDTLTQEEYRARLEEKGRSPERIAAVIGPQKLIQFEATAVLIQN